MSLLVMRLLVALMTGNAGCHPQRLKFSTFKGLSVKKMTECIQMPHFHNSVTECTVFLDLFRYGILSMENGSVLHHGRFISNSVYD